MHLKSRVRLMLCIVAEVGRSLAADHEGVGLEVLGGHFELRNRGGHFLELYPRFNLGV